MTRWSTRFLPRRKTRYGTVHAMLTDNDTFCHKRLSYSVPMPRDAVITCKRCSRLLKTSINVACTGTEEDMTGVMPET